MYITRRERFSASHKLYNDELQDHENEKLFGKCFNLHGHNYELFVTVTGKINPISGFIIDLKNLKKVIHERIINKIDHNDINNVDFMKNKISTTENLCIGIWNELENPIEILGGKLHKIKLNETENNSFEYFGKINNYV
tara:strand:+ start:13289 stop:13705 length:417 start_codon:yes stop_codon:yes gene_type:complete